LFKIKFKNLLLLVCQQNLELLNASAASDVWMAYVDYVDEIIVDGFFNTIMCSLKFMIENTDAKRTTEPLYEAILELQVRFLYNMNHV